MLIFMISAMARTLVSYALALALAATLLNWLEYRYLARAFSTEIYIGILAAGFIALGAWVGRALTPRARPAHFRRNEAAIRSLGLSPREVEILEALVTGESNKELARRLGISPNTAALTNVCFVATGAPSPHQPEVSRGERLDQFRRQIAALFDVPPIALRSWLGRKGSSQA